ncbi:MAG: hypothetical protein AABY18_07165 [Candidatus Thermoplasmatota archaeon]|mgnify:CR=1 FL=1
MPPPLGCDEVLFSDAADEALAALQGDRAKEAASTVRRIAAIRFLLAADCQAGEVIPLPLGKAAKPIEARNAPLSNLYCVDLPAFWRLLYTIVRAEGRRYVVVLEIVDHRKYDKWFPNKGR